MKIFEIKPKIPISIVTFNEYLYREGLACDGTYDLVTHPYKIHASILDRTLKEELNNFNSTEFLLTRE